VASNPPKENKTGVTGLPPDKLSRKELRSLYNMTYNRLRVDDDIFNLFQTAFKEQWTQARWDSELEQTDWYRNNAASVRNYLMQAADPNNADFLEKKKDSSEYVRRTAMNLGVPLDVTTLNDLTEQSMMFGWGEQANAYELERAILKTTPGGFEDESEADTTDYVGDIGANASKLQALAYANGVEFNEGWYNSAAKSIASGLSQEDFWQQKIRQEAASTFPVFKDQIEMGANVADIASPYMKTMADLWELNVNDIKLTDPTLLGALTNYDEKGNARAMNLGAFRDQLRKDPRWMETDKAQNEIAGITSKVMEMFGLVG
jgi:hypothetical protein